MSISCTPETISQSNYKDVFTNKYVSESTGPLEKSCLLNGGFTNSDGSLATTISESSMNSWIPQLITSFGAAAPSINDLTPEVIDTNTAGTNPALVYSQAAQRLRESIQREYCFYQQRYKWALTQVLTSAANNQVSQNTNYNEQKTNVIALNAKLNQILQVLKALTNNRLNTLNDPGSGYYSTDAGVNLLNNQVTSLRNELDRDSKALKDKSLEINVQSAMIDYSLEKNASSRNLLGIYGFMNIVAIGLLYYIYRSSKA